MTSVHFPVTEWYKDWTTKSSNCILCDTGLEFVGLACILIEETSQKGEEKKYFGIENNVQKYIFFWKSDMLATWPIEIPFTVIAMDKETNPFFSKFSDFHV